MSYSIGVRAASKAEAKQALADKFDTTVMPHQKVHAKDRDQALAAAAAFIDLLPEDESKDLSVSMSGSLSGDWQGGDLVNLTGAGVNVYVNLVAKEESKS